jgi:hypothetical protein
LSDQPNQFEITHEGHRKCVAHFAAHGDAPIIARTYETHGDWREAATVLTEKWRKRYGLSLSSADFRS